MKKISLCSYTYNDGELLHGLLAHIADWPRLPDEIVLVDDGSEQPFALTEGEKKLPLRLISLPENTGFRAAKHRGISEASGDIIVSIDCDIRLQGDFLTRAEELLQDGSVGLIGVADSRQAPGDALSSYLSMFELEPRDSANMEADFIPGVVFALRREVWEETGGMSGYGLNLAEDYYLSVTVKKRGYRLLLENTTKARFTRLLDRPTFSRRLWKRYEPSWLAALRKETPLSSFFSLPMLAAKRHINAISGAHPPCWIYFELLAICHVGLMLCNTLAPAGAIPTRAGADFLQVIESALAPHPALLRLLRADLMRGGALPLLAPHSPDPEDRSTLATRCDWADFAAFLQDLEESSALKYLDKIGVKELLEDEAGLRPDFSSY